MMSDEQAIRTLFDAWQRASRAGDMDTLLGFATDDAVFLAPGQPPIRGRAATRDPLGAWTPAPCGRAAGARPSAPAAWACPCRARKAAPGDSRAASTT